MTVVVRFRRRQPKRSPLLTSSALLSISPLSSPLQLRVRSLTDRYQVLVLRKPAAARLLIEWVDLFLSRNDV
jgi:hypothetical protein